MADNKPRIAIVTNVIPNYRVDFFRRILADDQLDIRIYCAPSIPGMSLKTAHDQFTDHITLVTTWCLPKEKLAWQWLPFWRLAREYDITFFYGNPRVISNVVFSLLLKLLRKKIVIWGQSHTAGANPVLEQIRLYWWRCFDYLFLYTDHEIEYLKSRGFNNQNMLGMNNGLNQEEIDSVRDLWTTERLDKWRKEQNLDDKILLLSCARLEAKNQFELIVPALKQLIKKHPNIIWCIIGKGEQEPYLQFTVKHEGITENVLWLGSIYEEEKLAPWFLSSLVLIHPGAIGLSLLHAFGYGLPVITHDDVANQMPEFAIFENGKNGQLFRKGKSKSLAHTIENFLDDPDIVHQLGINAYQTASNKFNTRIMAQRFIKFAKMANVKTESHNRGTVN